MSGGGGGGACCPAESFGSDFSVISGFDESVGGGGGSGPAAPPPVAAAAPVVPGAAATPPLPGGAFGDLMFKDFLIDLATSFFISSCFVISFPFFELFFGFVFLNAVLNFSSNELFFLVETGFESWKPVAEAGFWSWKAVVATGCCCPTGFDGTFISRGGCTGFAGVGTTGCSGGETTP